MPSTTVEELGVKLVGDASGWDEFLDHATDKLDESVAEATALTKELEAAKAQAVREAAQVAAAVATPMEKYRATQQHLASLVQQNVLSVENYNRALEQARQVLPHIAEKEAQKNQQMMLAKQITDSVASSEEVYAQKIAQLDALLKKELITQQTFNKAQQELAATLPANIAATEELNKQTEQAAAIYKNVETRQEAYSRKLNELNRLQRAGALDATTHKRAIAQLRNEFGTSLAMVDAFGKKLTAVGTAMSFRITTPLVAMGAMATKQFASFDTALTTSMAIMDNVTSQHRVMMDQTAKEIAINTGTDPTEVAKGYYYLASAGYDVESSIKAVAITNKFAKAGAMDLAVATEQLADAQNALGLKTDNVTQNLLEMTRVSDVLVDAANASNASVMQLSEALTNKAAGAMKGLNIELEEGAAVLSVFANKGKKGAEAGTLMDIMLRELNKSANENKEQWKAAGMELYDSTGKMRKIADVVGDLEDKMAGLSDQQKYAMFTQLGFRSESMMALRPLIGQSAELRKLEQRYLKVGGVTEKVAGIQMKSFAETIGKVWAQIKVLGIEIGQALVPYLISAGEYITQAVTWFRGLDEGTKGWVMSLGLIAAAAGPVLLIMGKIVSMSTAVYTATMAMYGAMKGAVLSQYASSMAGYAKSLLMAVGPMNLLAGGLILAVGAGLGALAFKYSGLAESVDMLNKSLERQAELEGKHLLIMQARRAGMIGEAMDSSKSRKERMDNLGEQIKAQMNELDGHRAQVAAEKKRIDDNQGWTQMAEAKAARQAYAEAIERNNAAYDTLDALRKQRLILAREIGQAKREMQEGTKNAAVAAVANAAGINGLDMGGGFDPNKMDDMAKAMEEGKRLAEEVRNPAEKYAATVAKLDNLQQVGAITQETYNRALANAKKEQDEAGTGAGKNAEAIADFTRELQTQVDMFGKSGHAAKLHELELKGATDAELENAKALVTKLDGMEEAKKQQEAANKLIEKYMTPMQKLNKAEAELTGLRDKGLITMETYNEELEAIRKDFSKETKVKFKVEGIDGVDRGLEAMLKLDEYLATKAKNQIDVKNLGVRDPVQDPEFKPVAFKNPFTGERPLDGDIGPMAPKFAHWSDPSVIEPDPKQAAAVQAIIEAGDGKDAEKDADKRQKSTEEILRQIATNTKQPKNKMTLAPANFN